jgi:DNA-binding transcriptional regulator YhcF (GntR family)
MDLKLDRDTQLPLHTQLKAQLVYLIQSGQMAVGAQLPTVRQLAGFLRVNRNTVAKVFAEMQRDGLLSCEPGRGTFVAPASKDSGSKVERMQQLLAVVDEAIQRASELGFSPQEVFLTLYARTQAPARATAMPLTRALFIECSQAEADVFGAELQRELAVPVDPMLLPTFAETVRKEPATLAGYPLIITTFYHIHEVQTLLAGTGAEAFALMVDTSLETLMRLMALPEGTTVGVACTAPVGSENMKVSIQRAGLKHLRVVTACGDERAGLKRMLETAAVVVCSSLVEATVRSLAPKGKEIIVDHKRLDKAGIEMLRARVRPASPRTRPAAELQGRMRGVAPRARRHK